MDLINFFNLNVAEIWVFLVNFAHVLSDVTYHIYLYYRPCVIGNEKDMISCFRSDKLAINSTLEMNSMVHEPIGKYIYLVWGLLLGALYGAWSDRVGRTNGMVIVSIGLVFFNFFIAIDFDMYKISYPIIPICARLLVSLSSHYVIIYTLAFAHQSDATTRKNRLNWFIFMDIILRVSSILAAFALLFLSFMGLSPIILITVNVGLLATTVAKYKPKSNLFPRKIEDVGQAKTSKLYELSWHFRDTFQTLFKNREFNGRSDLIFYLFMYAINDFLSSCIMEVTTVVALRNRILNWDAVTVGGIRLVCELSLLVGSSIAWNLINYSTFSFIREPQFILIGLAFRPLQILPAVVTKASHEPYLIVGILGIFTSLIGPAILVHAISITEPNETGKVLGSAFGLSCLFRVLLESLGKKSVYDLSTQPPNVIWGPIFAISSILFIITGLKMRNMVKEHEKRNQSRELSKEPSFEESNSTKKTTQIKYRRKTTGIINSGSEIKGSESLKGSDFKNNRTLTYPRSQHSCQQSTCQTSSKVPIMETPTVAEPIDLEVSYASTLTPAKQPSNRIETDPQSAAALIKSDTNRVEQAMSESIKTDQKELTEKTSLSIIENLEETPLSISNNLSIKQIELQQQGSSSKAQTIEKKESKKEKENENENDDEDSDDDDKVYTSDSESYDSDSCTEYDTESKNLLMVLKKYSLAETPDSSLYTNTIEKETSSRKNIIDKFQTLSEERLLKRRQHHRLLTRHMSS